MDSVSGNASFCNCAVKFATSNARLKVTVTRRGVTSANQYVDSGTSRPQIWFKVDLQIWVPGSEVRSVLAALSFFFLQ